MIKRLASVFLVLCTLLMLMPARAQAPENYNDADVKFVFT